MTICSLTKVLGCAKGAKSSCPHLCVNFIFLKTHKQVNLEKYGKYECDANNTTHHLQNNFNSFNIRINILWYNVSVCSTTDHRFMN